MSAKDLVIAQLSALPLRRDAGLYPRGEGIRAARVMIDYMKVLGLLKAAFAVAPEVASAAEGEADAPRLPAQGGTGGALHVLAFEDEFSHGEPGVHLVRLPEQLAGGIQGARILPGDLARPVHRVAFFHPRGDLGEVSLARGPVSVELPQSVSAPHVSAFLSLPSLGQRTGPAALAEANFTGIFFVILPVIGPNPSLTAAVPAFVPAPVAILVLAGLQEFCSGAHGSASLPHAPPPARGSKVNISSGCKVKGFPRIVAAPLPATASTMVSGVSGMPQARARTRAAPKTWTRKVGEAKHGAVGLAAHVAAFLPLRSPARSSGSSGP